VRWYVAILYRLIRAVGLLPLPFLQRCGALLGALLYAVPNPMRRKANATLSLVITQLQGETRQALLKSALREVGKSAFEVCRIWSVEPAQVLALIREVRGAALFDAALESGRGLIIAAPHLGCWELLNFWLCSRTPIAIAYRPPRQSALEPLLLRMRGALSAEQVRADGPAGVRKLYKRLAGGGVVGILPDQQPKLGAGVFAPFFGRQALTLTLIPKLAERSGSPVLLAWAEPVPGGFDIVIEDAPAGIADADVEVATTAMNAAVESIARRCMEWYQWTYKRFSRRPKGAGEKNPYYPDCY